MKAVIKSVPPYLCKKITTGECTFLFSKTRPKQETPFKSYIYCTKDKWLHLVQMPDKTYRIYNGKDYGIYDKSLKFEGEGNGKVVGEFVCDYIDENYPILISRTEQFIYTDEWVKGKVDVNMACLSINELKSYGKGKPLYGWHISDLKIYDKPKELGEFKQTKIVRGYHKKDDIKQDGIIIERLMHGTRIISKTLTRPPQSWCYVEELE